MEQSFLRVGFIGYGAVGQEVARVLAKQAVTDIMLVGALVRHAAYPRPQGSPKIVTTLSELLNEKPQVIIEVAGHAGLREYGPAVLRSGVDLILISVGALAEPDLMQELLDAAKNGGSRAKVVSGAIGALDALTAASLGGLSRVIHTMRKPPKALLPNEEAAHLATTREIFRGSARQAAAHYPEFLNVAASVALAGNGFDQTEVRVLADPSVEHSIHEILAEGVFGTLRFEIENAPISSFGRGAQLVAMSIVHTLLLRRALLVIGS